MVGGEANSELPPPSSVRVRVRVTVCVWGSVCACVCVCVYCCDVCFLFCTTTAHTSE